MQRFHSIGHEVGVGLVGLVDLVDWVDWVDWVGSVD